MTKYLVPLLLAVAIFAFPTAAAVVSDFSYTVDSFNPLTIHFIERSTGGAGNWFWMFDDGGAVSNERNPTFTFSNEGTYMISCAAQTPDYCEEDTVRKQLVVTHNGTNDNSSSPSSDENSSNGQPSEGSNRDNCFPDISFCGIRIPNPLDLIDEYIKLIQIMIIPSNYKFMSLCQGTR
jgi:PKD repeat protein